MDVDSDARAVTARTLPSDVQLRRTDDAGGWHVFRSRSAGESPAKIGSVGKVAGEFSALGPDGHRIAGPLDRGRWPTRGAAVAAIRAADVAAMSASPFPILGAFGQRVGDF
jgi:hypothetical protein